jgi:hypothetical protein
MGQKHLFFFIILVIFTLVGSSLAPIAMAQTTNPAGTTGELFFAPSTGTFQEGSTFEVPIFINTKGRNINAIELLIKFDPKKLSIVNPSGGKSIIGLWIQPPSFDNTKGTVSIIGGIPNGLTTSSGLIVTMTFKAKAAGSAVISIGDTSKVLLNDGLGGRLAFKSNRATYTVVPKPPEGVTIFSDTHPFQDQWYNNKSPVFAWNKDEDVTGFSVTFDNIPNTVPGDTVTTADPMFAVNNTNDGVWYVHVKALKKGIWGSTSHFLTRIDSTPPAEFVPVANYLMALVATRSFITFFTTDSLSGVDHYEVGVIDISKAATESPAFFEASSPYQLPLENINKARVIVRAFDHAGNIRDASVDINSRFYPWLEYAKKNPIVVMSVLFFLIIILLILYFMVDHHTIHRVKRAFALARKEEEVPMRTPPTPPTITAPEDRP